MFRKDTKETKGRFILIKHSRYSTDYYLESGVSDVGTPWQERYLYWTPYKHEARAFVTIKQAKAVAEKLMLLYGVKTVIADLKGRAV